MHTTEPSHLHCSSHIPPVSDRTGIRVVIVSGSETTAFSAMGSDEEVAGIRAEKEE
ncbi:hypothetical protein F2Q70_00022038 [Brassica cretica]|uniref:Uncharacterized protein n=1 Tax=Brassica cretica TaxID=69181 RepID=A0A8S9RTN7_BRACR|nr:hypothetical protein F2Q70_00022038 [Brassica cretica]KAF2559394.1 hypothetical protein F2Q68_00015831 [Brassica cretica]KAF3584130.1 hypothetical protein F2Q69_00029652 [Brassica cretica]